MTEIRIDLERKLRKLRAAVFDDPALCAQIKEVKALLEPEWQKEQAALEAKASAALLRKWQ